MEILDKIQSKTFKNIGQSTRARKKFPGAKNKGGTKTKEESGQGHEGGRSLGDGDEEKHHSLM